MRSSLLRPPPSEPDRYERGIRLGCGALFGLVVGFLASRNLWLHSNVGPFIVAGCVAAAAALLANRLGDDFWWTSLLFIGVVVALVWIIAAVIEARAHHWSLALARSPRWLGVWPAGRRRGLDRALCTPRESTRGIGFSPSGPSSSRGWVARPRMRKCQGRECVKRSD